MKTNAEIIARLTEVQHEIGNADTFTVSDAGYTQLLKERFNLAHELCNNVAGDRPSYNVDLDERYLVARDRFLALGKVVDKLLDEPKAMGQLKAEASAGLNAALQAGEDSVSYDRDASEAGVPMIEPRVSRGSW